MVHVCIGVILCLAVNRIHWLVLLILLFVNKYVYLFCANKVFSYKKIFWIKFYAEEKFIVQT